MEKLPEDFKQKWISALRSGQYKQGKQSLCKDDKYCCLGVAYRIAKGVDPIDTVSGYIHGGEIDTGGVPEILVGTGSSITGYGDTIRYKLAKMNDDGKSFSEIADYIEANL